MAIESVPSGSSTTTGFLRTPSVATMAIWGWLITGMVNKVPKGPALVRVKVPPLMSSMVSRLDRARSARLATSRARARSRLSAASWMTGTSRPSKLRSTAMPRLIRLCTMRASSPTELFMLGHSAMASMTARAMNGR